MPEEVKFSKEEMETLEEIQKKYASIHLQLGQLGFTKIRLENEIKIVNENEGKLKSEFNKVQSQEKTFMDSLCWISIYFISSITTNYWWIK